jgi:hypothetical protein
MAADHLFKFVKTLSKNEKVYIKRSASLHQVGDGNKYIKLFNALCEMKVYDEESLRTAFAKDPFFNNFSSAKSYLFNFILHSLESYHKSPRAEIGSLLHQVEILFEKGMLDQCRKKIIKAEEIANRFELVAYQYDIQSWKMNLRRPGQDEHTFRESNESFYEQMKLSLKQIQAITKDDYENYDILSKVMFLGAKSKEVRSQEMLELKSLIGHYHEEEKKIEKSGSFALKFGLYQKLMTLYQITSDQENRLHYLSKGILLFSEQPHMMELEPYFYVFLFNLREKFTLELKHGRYAHLMESFEILHEIGQKNLSKKLFFDFFSTQLKFGVCFMVGKFETARKYALLLNSFFDRVDLYELFALEKKVFAMESAVVELALKNYKNALLLTESVMESSTDEVRSDVYFFAQVFQLLIHYEKGDQEMIEYRARSVYRYLSLKKGFSRTEKLLFDFFRTEISDGYDKARTEAFIQLKQNYLNLIETYPEENLPVISFRLTDWMQSKIEHISIAEVLQEKYKNLFNSAEGKALIGFLESGV